MLIFHVRTHWPYYLSRHPLVQPFICKYEECAWWRCVRAGNELMRRGAGQRKRREGRGLEGNENVGGKE